MSDILELQISGNEDFTLEVGGSKEILLGLEKGSAGTHDYEHLINKPSIEGVTLIGDKTFPQLGLGTITEQDIDEIIFGGN